VLTLNVGNSSRDPDTPGGTLPAGTVFTGGIFGAADGTSAGPGRFSSFGG